jgi:hypothetical protein
MDRPSSSSQQHATDLCIPSSHTRSICCYPSYTLHTGLPDIRAEPNDNRDPKPGLVSHMSLPLRPPVIHEDQVSSSTIPATVDPTPQQQHQHQHQEEEDDWVLSGEQSWGAQSSYSLNDNESPDCTRHSEHHGVNDPFMPSSQCGGVHSMGRKRMSFTYVLFKGGRDALGRVNTKIF